MIDLYRQGPEEKWTGWRFALVWVAAIGGSLAITIGLLVWVLQ